MNSYRNQLINALVERILLLSIDRPQIVAIDGVDGAGKTVLADELFQRLKDLGRPIIRSSVDGFHNPRDIRYRLGKTSSEGFFRDSYNYEMLKKELLDPFKQGENNFYQAAMARNNTL